MYDTYVRLSIILARYICTYAHIQLIFSKYSASSKLCKTIHDIGQGVRHWRGRAGGLWPLKFLGSINKSNSGECTPPKFGRNVVPKLQARDGHGPPAGRA